MKKVILYICTAIIVFIANLVYGLTIGGEIPILLFLAELLIMFIVFSFIEAKFESVRKLGKVMDYVKITLCAVLTVLASAILYNLGNTLSSDLIREYDAVVSYVDYRDYTVYFVDPEGVEQFHTIGDSGLFIKDDAIEEGDTVHIKEMNGLFKMVHYIIDDA